MPGLDSIRRGGVVPRGAVTARRAMTPGFVTTAVVVLLGAPIDVVAAQQPPATPSGSVLRVRTNTVVLHVSVRDTHRRPVAGLACDAFTVFEDGVAQQVGLCEPGTAPMAIGLVIDSSTSMARYRELLAAAGAAFVRLGSPDDQVFVIQFNEHVRNALPGKRFTSDAAEVGRSVAATTTRGRTAMLDALWEALEVAETGDRLKKAIVLVSDGGDNASGRTFQQVLERAQHDNVPIFAISISDAFDKDANPGRLRELARDTGGLVFTPGDDQGIDEAFGQISRDLRAGYTLAYTPTNERDDGAFRVVRVTVRSPVGGGRLVVRTRSGYLAPGATDDAQR